MKRLIFINYFFFSFLFCSINNICVVHNTTVYPKLLTSSFSIPDFPFPSFSQEGFCANTSVKTIAGYTNIQDLKEGDIVVEGNDNKKVVVGITKKYVKQYVRLVIDDTVLCVGCDQQYCVLPEHIWVAAQDIKVGDCLLNHAHECCKVSFAQVIRKELLLYALTVEDHILCIAPYDICAHNTQALVLGVSSVCLGYITAINPIMATIGIATAFSSIAYKAYQDYIHRSSLNDSAAVLPQEVLLAERFYYEQRKVSLETIRQELLSVKSDLLNIKALCGNSCTHQLLQQNNITHVCNQYPLLKIAVEQEMQLSDKQKIDLRALREAELVAIEQDIIILQNTLALHCNAVIEQVQSAFIEYDNIREQTSSARVLWNKNAKNINYPIALALYKAEVLEEHLIMQLNQKFDELKALANYYRSMHSNCLKESTNIIDSLEKVESVITQYDQEFQKAKVIVKQNISVVEEHFARRGISVTGIRNETKNVLEQAQKNNTSKTFAQIKNQLSNMVSSGGPYKDPKDNEPEKDLENKRVVNTMTKTEFFQKVRDQYEYWQNNIYRRKCGAKGIENAEYLRWDHLHNDVEAYTAGRKHLGSINPHTLRLYKGPVIGRKPF